MKICFNLKAPEVRKVILGKPFFELPQKLFLRAIEAEVFPVGTSFPKSKEYFSKTQEPKVQGECSV